MCSVVGQALRDIGARRLRQEDDRPHARRRKLHQPDAAEARSGFREQRLEDLLEAAIDRPDDRRAVEDVLAELDQLAPDQVGGQEAEQRQRREDDDQARAWKMERQIGFETNGRRHERPHDVVDPVDEPPGQADRDVERSDQDQPGQKIVSDAADDAGAGALSVSGLAAGLESCGDVLVGIAHPCDMTLVHRGRL